MTAGRICFLPHDKVVVVEWLCCNDAEGGRLVEGRAHRGCY